MNANNDQASLRQYVAFTSGGGFVELTDWASVTLRGADRQTFLNNFCTNEVKRLSPGESCEAFFTNVKGKIVGHGLVTCRGDELVVIGPPGQGAALAAHLDRYVIREDVQVRDTTAERTYLLVAGDDRLRGMLADMKCFPWRLIDAEFVGLLESTPTELSVSAATLSNRGLEECEPIAFKYRRIEAGTPLFNVDFDEHNLPQEVGRNMLAISFTKGCYLGQETVARIDALGHVNQQIVGVAFSGAQIPDVGMELTNDGRNVGQVTSAALSPALDRPLALAMVRREHNAEGTKLDSAVGPCEVVALPVTHRPAAS
jgi:tRNA-modifying protein YgfZ